jgi:hypothetical protein
VAGTDVVALADPYAPDYLVLRRSRGRFARLLLRGVLAGLRLAVQHRGIRGRWRAAFGRLTGPEFWHRYLGLRPAPGRRGSGELAEGGGEVPPRPNELRRAA